MKGYCFIVNPIAGKGRAEKLLPFITSKMQEKALNFQIKLTSKKGQGKELAEEAIAEGFDFLIAVGGDGTLNEVVNGAYGKDVAIGIIPAGTGNDFARALNMPTDFNAAIEGICSGSVSEIDVGNIDGRLFLNVASIGLDAHIAAEANKIKKYVSGTNAYILALIKGLFTFKGIKVILHLEDKLIQKEIMLAAFCNGSYYGGGMKIAPEASPSDDLLDICVVERMPKLKLLRLFPTIFKGKHTVFSEVKTYRTKAVSVCIDSSVEVNTDGETTSCKLGDKTSQILQVRIAENKLKVLRLTKI